MNDTDFNTYKERRFDSRQEYLEDLAYSYECPRSVVFALAQALGPGEDFDGLLVELEDYTQYK